MTFRYSMRTIAVVMTLIALALAGIMAAHSVASSAVYTLNWVLLCLSLAAVCVVRGEQRRFWIGFAIFAWSYWLLAGERSGDFPSSTIGSRVGVIGSGSWQTSGASAEPIVHPARLMSSHLIDLLESQATPGWSIGSSVMARWRGGSFYPGVIIDTRPGEYLIRWTDGSSSPNQWTVTADIQREHYDARVAANCFVCSLWGLIGGLLVTLIFRHRESRRPATVHETPIAENTHSSEP